MTDPSVELVGDFERDEAGFLRATFDHCRIELLARSRLDPSLALLRWTAQSKPGGPSVTDARRVPPAAYYVLEPTAEFQLTPIHSWDELEELYPGHFEQSALPETARPRGCLFGLLGAAGAVVTLRLSLAAVRRPLCGNPRRPDGP